MLVPDVASFPDVASVPAVANVPAVAAVLSRVTACSRSFTNAVAEFLANACCLESMRCRHPDSKTVYIYCLQRTFQIFKHMDGCDFGIGSQTY